MGKRSFTSRRLGKSVCVFIIVLISCLLVSCDRKKDADKDESSRSYLTLEGSWRGYSGISDYVVTLRFSSNEFYLKLSDRAKFQGTYSVEKDSEHNKIRLTHPSPEGDTTFYGLYKYASKSLILVMNTNKMNANTYPKSLSDPYAIWFVLSKGRLPQVPDYFEFELEFINPSSPGTYIISTDGFEAVDFKNSGAPYNTHAYGGKVIITSVSPKYEGTFELTDFTPNHGQTTPFLGGTVSGSFSIPSDGSEAGIFKAAGVIGSHKVNLDFSTAYAVTSSMEGNNSLGFYRAPF